MLKAENRLRKRQDFHRIYKRGTSFVASGMVLYIRKNNNAHFRVGFSVSKKVGKAVKRNKVKRRLRHIARNLSASFCQGFDYIFIARPSLIYLPYDKQVEQMTFLLNKARKKRCENGVEKNG